MTSDLELLGQYARNQAQDAFTEIVRRHVDLVYSAALRQVRSPQLAEEVAQSVFTDLARNAGKLQPDTVLTAWLYQVTRRTAVDVVRKESRRQLREQIASEINAMNATETDWSRVEPFLDEAMHTLDDTDRAAVLLRFFENKSFREVGQTLGTTDDAAQKRVSRAIEHLRELFAKRGVTVGASGLVVLIAANAIQAAPTPLAKFVAATALARAAAAGGSSITFVKGALKLMAWTNAKPVIFVGAGLLLTAGIAMLAARKINQPPNYHAYTIQGNVELKSIRRSAWGVYYYDVVTNPFEMCVKNDQWLVTLSSQHPEVYDYRILSSDGACLYRLMSYETGQKKAVLAGEKPFNNIADGCVTRGNIPHNMWVEEAGAIWLAYASWRHFSEDPDRRQPVPFAVYISPRPVMEHEPPLVEKAIWQPDSSPPHLPTLLTYSADGSGNADDPARRGTDAPPEFTNVVYQTLAFADYDGLHLPVESMVSIYRLNPAQTGDATNQLCTQIHVWATNIVSGVPLVSFQPKLPGKTAISDDRFDKGGYLALSYMSETGWPSKQEVRNSKEYKVAKLAGGHKMFSPNRTSPKPPP